jgi:putative membrane protein
MYWDNGHMDAGWGVVMMVSMLAFWVLIALAVVWFARTVATPRPHHPPEQPSVAPTAGARRILAERLARGEIDTEDYQARMAALGAPDD